MADRDHLPTRRRLNRSFVVAVTALGLIAFLVYLVLIWPRTTPVIAVAATEYEIPVPINDWALEDCDSLRHLSNLAVTAESDKWNKEGGSAKDIIPKSFRLRRGAPLIVYISMHGIVTDKGEPCLLPPHVSIDNAKSWIRVADVLDELESFAPDRKILLILDCNRIRVNWNLGVLYNTFANRVEELVEKRTIGSKDQLAVLISAGPDQTNWASAELDGSAFGRYLQLGLAGAADQDSGFAWSRDVTLSELASYLQREVTACSLANRGEPQTPILVPKDFADFRLTFAAGSRTIRRLTEQLHSPKSIHASVSPAEVVPLWDQLDKLRSDHELVRWNPVACRDFEHKLLRVEELAHGGSAYAESAKQLFEGVQAELKRSTERAAQAGNSLGSQLDITSNGNWARIPGAAHSLPASEYFGACEPERAQAVREVWEAIGQPATDIEALITKGAEKGELAWNLSETQVLVSARQKQAFSLWPQSYEVLKTVQALSSASEGLAVPRLSNDRPGDERAHYYTRLVANQADVRRRQAEDTLFVGERNAGDSRYDNLAKQAAELYERSKDISDDATAALKVEDVALAETPYLAAWLCNPLARNLTGRDRLLEEELIPLVHATQQLGEEFNRHITDQDYVAKTVHPPFHELAEQVRAKHGAIKKAFDDELTDLESGLNDSQRLMALKAALTVPLIEGETRQKLVMQCAEISAALHREYFGSEAGEGHGSVQETGHGSARESTHQTAHLTGDNSSHSSSHESGHESSIETSSNYLELVESWERHPLLEILQIDAPAAVEPDERCEKAGFEARDELTKIHDTKTGSSVNRSANSIVGRRQELSLDERRFRALAALGHVTPPEVENPISNLRRYDLQQLLLWLGKRVMDGFWIGVTDRSGEPPFFARAAEDYFASAEMLDSAVSDQIEESRELLAKRWDSKTKSPVRIKIGADSNLLMTGGDDAVVSIKIAANSDVIEDYPKGIAALYLRNGTERRSDVTIKSLLPNSRQYVDLPLAPGVVQGFSAVVRDVAHVDVLAAAAFFRGHEDASDFIVPKLKGRFIVYSPNRYKSQSISLIGHEQQRSSIMIIVDCSASMGEKTVDRAEVGGPANLLPRMNVAKLAVNTMLREIARRNANNEEHEDIYVGVRLLGHRVRWTESAPFTIKQQIKYREVRPIPDNLAPSDDIELIHPIGRFDDTDAKNVRVLLENVEPWGFTPLFRALVDSLKDFANVDPNSRRTIIAITDGQNYVWAPPHPSVPEPREIHKQDVLETWNQYQIPIHILGYDLRTEKDFSISATDAEQARSEYEEIAKRTGGLFSDVRSGSQLLSQLRSRLAPDMYIIREASRGPAGSTVIPQPTSAKLNDTVPIQLPNRQPKKFAVGFRGMSKEVLLEGGEAIQLYVADEGDDIVAEPYPSSVQRISALAGSANSRDKDHMLRIQRPQKNKDQVTFRFALQRDPSVTHFTKRPVETWVEITPLFDDGSVEEPYVFYDHNFEPDTPVPVLRWVASNWPDSSKKARIRFWCKFDETPAEKISLRQVFDSPAKFQEFSIDRLDGIKFKIETVNKTEPMIYVEEKHEKRSPVFDSTRVQFESDRGIQPIVVKRQFDAEHGIVTHSFSFSKDEVPGLDALETAHICIANARNVKEGALRVPNVAGIEVEIASDDALFSPAATRSSR